PWASPSGLLPDVVSCCQDPCGGNPREDRVARCPLTSSRDGAKTVGRRLRHLSDCMAGRTIASRGGAEMEKVERHVTGAPLRRDAKTQGLAAAARLCGETRGPETQVEEEAGDAFPRLAGGLCEDVRVLRVGMVAKNSVRQNLHSIQQCVPRGERLRYNSSNMRARGTGVSGVQSPIT
ncbi:hypothetical protein HPB47_002333, partial [Ixodes persulcatus]